MIKKVTFTEIIDVWITHLWPSRVSDITSTSAMIYLGGYSLENMKQDPTFFVYCYENQIAGVNSGHKCIDGGYRSRGLFVFENYRKLGIGTNLLLATIEQAKQEKCEYVWSYPKYSSWRTYAKAGFILTSDWESSELGTNAYCRIDL